jgi:hypothetical protein
VMKDMVSESKLIFYTRLCQANLPKLQSRSGAT